MGDRKGESVVVEIVEVAGAAPPQPLATGAQVLATQAQGLATQAQTLAAQAQALSDRAPTDPAQNPEATYDEVEKGIFAYKEITILHDINEHYPIFKLALEDWERRGKHLSKSISRREGHSARLTNEIYSILGIFALFQGVVLIAVSQLTQKPSIELGVASLCGKTWFPIVLTGFATLVTIVGILYKFKCLRSLESIIRKERQAKIEITLRATRLRREGPERFRFHLHTNNSMLAMKSKLEKKRSLVIAILLIFTVIFILSYFVILCDTWSG